MVRRWFISLAGLALVSGSLAATGPVMAASATRHDVTRAVTPSAFRPGGLFHPAPGIDSAVIGGSRISYSTNWSGYAVTGSTFSTATASWTQVAIDCTSGDGDTDMSPWVGIDGFSDRTVEQTGTSGDCSGSSPDYYAWYEMFPRNVIIISKPVDPGDQFTATVTHTTGTSYSLVLHDITQGWTNSVTKSISAKDSSAEAVLEMAASHLTQFGTDPFTGFTVDGQPIGSFTSSPYSIKRMEIKVSGTLCDSTSTLASQENFTVQWLNAC